MRALLVLGLLAGTGCDTPVPSLRFAVSNGPTQSCGSLQCKDVSLACRTVISIRIIDPAVPDAPFLSQCERVPMEGGSDLCQIARIDLDPTPLPIRDLEVQVALYPESMVERDPDTDAYICPSHTRYDAVNGFPIEDEAAPAIGGRAFYRPGDETVTVTLGCTYPGLLADPVCDGQGSVYVSATVEDFDGGAIVTDPDRITVTVGEPRSQPSGRYELNPSAVTQLNRTVPFPPSWGVSLATRFGSFACLAVLDDAAQSTTALTCEEASSLDDDLRFVGARLSKPSLDQILRAVSLTQFPLLGLTIGIVIDSDGRAVPNQVVAAPAGTTIQYLASDRNSVVGSATSGGPLGGVFVSTDAPFGTVFSTTNGTPTAPKPKLGGRIDGKVTLVVLRFADDIIMP